MVELRPFERGDTEAVVALWDACDLIRRGTPRMDQLPGRRPGSSSARPRYATDSEAERLLESAGCPKVSLQIRSENADVIAFYRGLGYAPDDVVSLGKRMVAD